jgi:pyridoxal phosphate enzyme (YggS family)
MSIAENLAEVRAQIDDACRKAGRSPSTVTLVAVSKTHPSDAIREAYAAGQRDFGENYAQEFAAKREALADLPDLRWHFIGALQSNKVKLVVPGTVLVHAVDRLSVAEALSKRAAAAGSTVDLLVEVNVGGEASKAFDTLGLNGQLPSNGCTTLGYDLLADCQCLIDLGVADHKSSVSS